ncbi:hypothetical protein PQR02_07915 [Paraburkholderia sediminicola]|uniref:Uncharacterized protein n=1 Tax=Paraburkholderia rhynchosiae TaxID=487049 RepID=A0ACC7NII9_9BURK
MIPNGGDRIVTRGNNRSFIEAVTDSGRCAVDFDYSLLCRTTLPESYCFYSVTQNCQSASFDIAFQIRGNCYAIDEASAPFLPEMKNDYNAWRAVSRSRRTNAHFRTLLRPQGAQTGMRFARMIATVLIAHARRSRSERSRALSLASFQLLPARLDQRALQRMRQFSRESSGQEDDDRQ